MNQGNQSDGISAVTTGRLTSDQASQRLSMLTSLLLDAVESGASIGFLPPLSQGDAVVYWQGVIDALATPYCYLIGAWDHESLVGCVQLMLEQRANGNHRAEVSKLIVHTDYRRRGIGRQLMQVLEAEALTASRTTLVLDTRAGDPSQTLYTKLGYETCGLIPQYARSADGDLHTTVFMVKLLNPGT